MPHKDRTSQLDAEITNLKRNLEQAVINKKSLNSPEVLAISRQLDQKIYEYMKTKMKTRKKETAKDY